MKIDFLFSYNIFFKSFKMRPFRENGPCNQILWRKIRRNFFFFISCLISSISHNASYRHKLRFDVTGQIFQPKNTQVWTKWVLEFCQNATNLNDLGPFVSADNAPTDVPKCWFCTPKPGHIPVYLQSVRTPGRFYCFFNRPG